MSNVIYSFLVNHPGEGEDPDIRAIDSNQLVDERMAEIERERERKRLEREAAERVRIIEEPLLDEDGEPILDEDGNPVMQEIEVHDDPADDFTDMQTLLAESADMTEGEFSGEDDLSEEMPTEPVQPVSYEPPPELLEQALEEAREQGRAEAERMIAEANEQAQSIINDAQSQAQAIHFNAEKEGREEGFQQGTAQAMANLEGEKQKLRQREEDLRNAYLAKEEGMEKELVEVISRVLEKVFLVKFADDRDVIYHLIDGALSNAEGSKQLQIKVNEANGEHIREKLAAFQEKLGADVQLDLIIDPLMGDEECLIETDGGMFDCGLDTELRNLMKKIRMLS